MGRSIARSQKTNGHGLGRRRGTGRQQIPSSFRKIRDGTQRAPNRYSRDRALAERGRTTAGMAGILMAEHGCGPNLVWNAPPDGNMLMPFRNLATKRRNLMGSGSSDRGRQSEGADVGIQRRKDFGAPREREVVSRSHTTKERAQGRTASRSARVQDV